jgi:hypothetical protein
MAVRHRKKGEVAPIVVQGAPGVGGLADYQRNHRQPQFEGDGVQVTLRAIRGLTSTQVLRTPFAFQCPPLESLARDGQYAWEPYTTIRRGQFARPSGRQLSTIQFETVFVSYDVQGTVLADDGVDSRNPVLLASRLEAIMRRGTPFELMIGQKRLWGQLDVHWGPSNENAAVLTGVRVEERAGEVDARYLTVSLQEFRSVELLRKNQGTGHSRGRDLPIKLHINQLGHVTGAAFKGKATLHNLAVHFYGEASMWKGIVRRNGALKGVAPSDDLGTVADHRKDNKLVVVIPALTASAVHAEGHGVDALHGPVPDGE